MGIPPWIVPELHSIRYVACAADGLLHESLGHSKLVSVIYWDREQIGHLLISRASCRKRLSSKSLPAPHCKFPADKAHSAVVF